jgi:WD40 repeat protein
MRDSIRDLVFISYSHRDRIWLDRILTFLKPLVREENLSIWSDALIEPGDRWRREISHALQRSAVGLLLVTQDFLASDFIHDEELPALIEAAERGVLRLIWVPVSASSSHRSLLKDYQAALDLKKPLDRLDKPRRNAALVQIAEAVADAAAKYITAIPTPPASLPRPERTARQDQPPREHLGIGELYGVPALPPHYIPRAEDLDRLRRALLEDRAGPLGITGEPYRLGLHGQGGIGKSVLAAALARDKEVRRAFPDGVFWVTVGQTPDIPSLQAALLSQAGARITSVANMQEGRTLLERHFQHRTTLLVLDDVWDYGNARTFDVLGDASRLLVTTRDGAVLTALGAQTDTIGRLPDQAALDLLAKWAGVGPAQLPKAASAVAGECGWIPLALSVAGAKVRDGTPWKVVLKALEQGRVEFLDHPYSNVFRSLRLGVDALPGHERERYLELAVFPEDEPVPEPVVLALWNRTGGVDELAGQDLLARLGRKALLEVVTTSGGRAVALHDLQHDYLRISAGDLPGLHAELLAALGAGLADHEGVIPWWSLPPDEAYTWMHLASHLVAAGKTEELRALLFDCRWLEAKLRAVGIAAVISDFAALPRDQELSLLAGALRLSGHVLSGDSDQLRSQLTGRLLGLELPRLQRMLRSARADASGPWLRPTMPSLTAPTGALLRTLVGSWSRYSSRSDVSAVAVTPDGRRAVSAAGYRTMTVWDVEKGVEERTIEGETDWLTAVAVTPDGRRAVSGSDHGTATVWDLETGTSERLGKHAARVVTVVVTPDGRLAISGDRDGTLKVWDLETRSEEHTRVADAGGCVAVTPDGRCAVIASYRGAVTVWDLEAGTERRLAGHGDSATAVAVTPDGRRAISGDKDGRLKIWNLETGLEEHAIVGHAAAVMTVAVTPDGRSAVVSSEDRKVEVWDLETGAEERTFSAAASWLAPVAVTPDGRRAVSAGGDRTVNVWDLDTEAEEHTLATRASVGAVTMTPDGRWVVYGSQDGTVKVWDLEAEGEPRTLGHHKREITAVAVTPDGRIGASGSQDAAVNVWDWETGTMKHTFSTFGWVRAVAVAPDGRRAVACGNDGTIMVWNLETGAREHTARCAGDVTAVAVTPDGTRAVLGVADESDESVVVLDLGTGAKERTLEGWAAVVSALAVTPDGRRAVSGSYDGYVTVWDLEVGAMERTLHQHTDEVVAVAVTPDGRRAASSYRDRTMKVWDLERGCALATFTADAVLASCAIGPDGVRLVAGDRLGRMHSLVLEGFASA